MLKKIILDCDPGHDDAVAIMLAAANEDIEILGITCVGGNTTLEKTDRDLFRSGCHPGDEYRRCWTGRRTGRDTETNFASYK